MEPPLARRQREIMDAIHRLGKATANEVMEALDDDLANATVRTQLGILLQRGLLKRERRGKQYVYLPASSPARTARSAFRKVLDIFFGGSIVDAVGAHLADPKTNLSDEELKRLRQILREHEKDA
ncbi:MAG: BlaI/MecI/CopY family transcriptional regulator [Planctomycetota bacterium]